MDHIASPPQGAGHTLDPMDKSNDKPPVEGDTCRICRSEASETEPLFYPCKCSGSIKFVHQDCLMEWLSHSNKKYCELCKTPFRFTKLYDSHMPTKLPMHIFVRKAAVHTLRYLLTWARAVAVALVWLVLLPWCIRWSWRGLFWLLDAGWARDAWLAKEENLHFRPSTTPSLAESVETTLNTSLVESTRNVTVSEPVVLNLSKMLISALLNPWRPFGSHRTMDNAESASLLARAASSTLLSDVRSLNSLTASPYLNRFILDVLEGQIVTFLIVIAFILVFLIREWVVQQQPIINAAAQLRDAEMQIEVVDRAAQRLRDARQGQLVPQDGDVAQILNQVPHEDPRPDDIQELPGDTAFNDTPDEARPREDTRPTDHNDDESPSQPETPGDASQAHPLRRPAMRPRDSSARLNPHVLLEMDEEDHSIPGPAEAQPEDGNSTGSNDSWQAVEETSNTDSGDFVAHPIPNYQDLAEANATSLEPPNDVINAATNESITSSTEADRAVELVPVQPLTNHTDQSQHDVVPDPAQTEPVVPEQTTDINQTDAIGAGLVRTPSAAHSSEDLQQSDHVNGTDPVRMNLLQRVLNWFWEDIVPDADGAEPQPANPLEEALVQNEAEEAPFVRFQVDEEDAAPAQPDDALPGQDPEVLQAAAEAGLDADALDDVEDLEGILELIGMQGPLVGLLQTAMFCGVLITTTLWAALGVPYLCGKFALLFLGDPVVFFVMAPIRLVTLISDAVVDATIYVGGLVTYLAANTMSMLAAWVMQPSNLKAEPKTFDFLSSRAHNAIHAASGRLSNSFAGESPIETGFLMVSLHAHQSLHTLQRETAHVIAFVVRIAAITTNHLQHSTLGQTLHSIASLLGREIFQAKKYYSWINDYFGSNFMTSVSNGTLTLKVNRGPTDLDPSLAYWSASDRCLTIFTGYVFLAMVGTMYLLRKEPLFTSPGLRQAEKAFTDFLKQAGGVFKVILIISIEMLAFPLYCGLLLDFALLPLFAKASIGSRVLFAIRSPWMFAFVHWFIGTCYMFHFALFVSACRRVMRSGVLYFIRDPDDPTFHPVRDVLERNVTTQLRKIAFSALVYGALVICCLGGVVWGIDSLFKDVFPIRWATPEPVYEFPIDFLLYNLLAPIVARFLLPSQGVEDLFKLWLKRCARGLRLSHFLFGDRRKDEEGHYAHSISDTIFYSKVEHSELIRDGRYVRAPASDQVRIPKGDRVFLDVTPDNKRVDGQPDSRTGLHGRKNKNFAKVYIPPWFRVRISLFIFSLWMFAAGTGVGITVVPMVFGRFFLSMMTPERVMFNDLYAFSVGLVSLGCTLWILLRSKTAYKGLRGNMSTEKAISALVGIKAYFVRALKSFYVYGFALIVVPTLFALVLQLYLIMPLHTYTAGWSTGQKQTSGAIDAVNATLSVPPMADLPLQPSSLLAGHTVHVLQDWTLGFLYGRVVLRLLMLSRNSRPATALRMITREGYTNPNAKLATRAFIAPTLLLFAIVLLFPPVFAMLANSVMFTVNLPASSLPQALQVKVYRYSYPLCASQGMILWGAWEVVKATQRWRNRIKDEVYLIGERLHNFGERRPPEGSKSAVRTR